MRSGHRSPPPLRQWLYAAVSSAAPVHGTSDVALVNSNIFLLKLYSKEIDASQAERLGQSCLSIVPRSRSHARLRRNATMSHAFSCVQPAFIDR
ncbi:hypothetical protein EVAR_62086_1 [Eumeta japonica]|uniref:Uncharacterized protein n=1 Tax=Eumeta variegata TaxID=151549 RepID=A0A4C1Z3Z7_EUMVA|nr:hypothetical protein EVAR_62086_1 [Eumeta japonica]